MSDEQPPPIDFSALDEQEQALAARLAEEERRRQEEAARRRARAKVGQGLLTAIEALGDALDGPHPAGRQFDPQPHEERLAAALQAAGAMLAADGLDKELEALSDSALVQWYGKDQDPEAARLRCQRARALLHLGMSGADSARLREEVRKSLDGVIARGGWWWVALIVKGILLGELRLPRKVKVNPQLLEEVARTAAYTRELLLDFEAAGPPSGEESDGQEQPPAPLPPLELIDGGFIYRGAREVKANLSGDPWKVLREFFHAPHRRRSSRELIATVWKTRPYAEDSHVTDAVGEVRKALKEARKQAGDPRSQRQADPLPCVDRGDNLAWELRLG